MKINVLLLILIFFNLTFSQDINNTPPTVSFENLEYAYNVKYDPNISELIQKTRDSYPKDHPLFTDEFGYDDMVIIKTKLTKKNKDSYYVLFTQGPSGDPSFYFINAEKPDIYFGDLPGEYLVLPGNGYAYVESRANNHFQKRQKFKIEINGFKEVFQPFFYVGLKTYTLKPITIYKEKNNNEFIAKIPANYEVEVILTDENLNYLIKTSFGLLGWIHIPSSQYESNIIEGIYYQGD